MADRQPVPPGAVVVIDHRDPRWSGPLVELQRVAYRIEADLIGSDAIPPLHETERDLARRDLTVLAVLDEEQRPVAMIGYTRIGSTVDIDRLAVAPHRHRRGLARRLLQHVHDTESDATAFTVSTGVGNGPATALYLSEGYRHDGEVIIAPGVAVARFRRVRRY